MLEPLIGGADVGETLRARDFHLVNLLEGQDCSRCCWGSSAAPRRRDRRTSRSWSAPSGASLPTGRSREELRGSSNSTSDTFPTNEKPEILAKELDYEEHHNSAFRLWLTAISLFVTMCKSFLGDLLVHRGRRLQGAFVDLPAKEGDTLDVDVRERVLNLSSAADGEYNLVLLLVDAEVVVRRPQRFTGLHVEDFHQVSDHRLVRAVGRRGVRSVPRHLSQNGDGVHGTDTVSTR